MQQNISFQYHFEGVVPLTEGRTNYCQKPLKAVKSRQKLVDNLNHQLKH